MKVEQIGDLAHSTAANPAQFNIGDLIHVAMTWRHNSWGFESCYFSVIAPGDGASYGFSDINGSCDRRDYPDGRVPKRGYEVIDTAKPLYAGELSLNLVPGQTYEAVTEIYPWRNTEPGVSSRYFKIRPLSGGVSTATPHKHVQGRVDITGAWRGNGATGTVKAWYKKDGVGPYILAGQGLGWFSVYNLPAGRQTLEFYVYYDGKFETYVGSKTVDVLAGGVTALRLEDKRLRVNGWVDGGVKQIKMETVWPNSIDLGTCAVSDGKFSCLSEKALRASWHDIRITASRGSTDLILLNRQHIDVTPSARWADDNPGIRLQGQPFRLAVDKGEEATHLQAYWRRGEKGLWHVSGDLKLGSDRSVVLPDTADWLPTDRSQYMVIFWVRRGSANWSPDSEIRSFQVKPLPPEWSKPPAGSAPGRKVSVTLRPPPGVDVVQPQWRREGGDWTDGQAVALQNTRTQDHTIAIAESAAWSSGHYDIRLRVRKNEGLWSEPSEAKSVVMRPSSPAEVFRDSTLTVFDQHGKPLMGGANVTVGDQITYRLKLAAASAAEQIDLSLSLAGATQLQGQAGTLRYRAALSDPGDGAKPIDTTRLNKGWTGAGAAFGATTRLLVSGEDAPGMLAGKHAVIDIPVTVSRPGQIPGVKVIARGHSGGQPLAGQHEIAALDLRAVMPRPQWVWPATDSEELLAGQTLHIRGQTHPSADHVKFRWRDWRDGQYHSTNDIPIEPDANGRFDVELPDAKAWVPTASGESYQLKFLVSSAGYASAWTGVRHLRVRSGAGVLGGSSLTVYRGDRSLSANAGVAAGETLTLRLRMQSSHTALGLQWSLVLPAGLEKAGAPMYRADLSDQGRPPLIGGLVQIGTGTLNGQWRGTGGAFGVSAQLLDPVQSLLGLVGGKHAVLDIPVRVKAEAQGAILVKAAGRATLVSQQDLAAPPLLVAKVPGQGAMTAALAPTAEGDRQPGEALTYRVTLVALKALDGVQLQYRLPAGLKQHGTPVFDAQSDLQQGLEAAWDGSPRHDALLAAGTALEAGRRIIVNIPLQVAPEAVDSRIDSRIEAAAGNVAGTVEARHALRVVPDKEADNGPLRLRTLVDKGDAKPGETLAYTIEFMNRSDQPLHELAIHEVVPEHTTLVPQSAVCKQMPAALACRVATLDEAHGTSDPTPIRWTFSGRLLPGEQGSVGFRVRVEH
ncbi:DUF11 domain-containing protein [Pandoraea thiooxydans]|uniref:DUF11 domain-containing protein n=1 Tax=Pandoraea thiooxydans TaxID=445709 RepID=UPI0012EBAED1|nr:DUF11 domain-containing protein [Pandoraea thiooxydans]